MHSKVDQKMSLADFQQLREKVKSEFMGPMFGGNFRKFAKRRGHERMMWLKEILFMGQPTPQELADDKKGHHQMYGEVIQEATKEKVAASFKAQGLGKTPTFFYCKSTKAWLTFKENLRKNDIVGVKN